MNILIKLAVICLFGFFITFSPNTNAEPQHEQHTDSTEGEHSLDQEHGDKTTDVHGHEDEHEDEHEESIEITLTKDQQALVGIEVEKLKARNLNYTIYAPGEVKSNGYSSYLVSPRTDSVVMKRHKALGDHVIQNDKLVTLFSESVAEAQTTLKISKAEWQRVQQLGRKTVGANRYITAQNDYELAKARLLAFGLSSTSINDASIPLGEYTLIANTDGAILSDDFQQGQRVEAGHALMLLSDESQLWVEARVQASIKLDLPRGTMAQIKVGESYYAATVSQEAHTIDENTRTRVIRLLVNNPEDALHPGEFADVYFSMSTLKEVMAVPENALMRSADGDWAVFIELADNKFTSSEVELGRIFGDYREIFGLDADVLVVTKGAFFVSSEIAKGGFDPHGH